MRSDLRLVYGNEQVYLDKQEVERLERYAQAKPQIRKEIFGDDLDVTLMHSEKGTTLAKIASGSGGTLAVVDENGKGKVLTGGMDNKTYDRFLKIMGIQMIRPITST